MTDAAWCPICGGGAVMQDGVWGAFPHDHKADLSGLDDGPYLPGHEQRERPAAKPPGEIQAIRAKAWATRRQKYGQFGHKGGTRP